MKISFYQTSYSISLYVLGRLKISLQQINP